MQSTHCLQLFNTRNIEHLVNITLYTVSKKHVSTFLIVEVELSVYKDFWHTYYQVYTV